MAEIETCKECGANAEDFCANCGMGICADHRESGEENWCFDCWESVGCIKEAEAADA